MAEITIPLHVTIRLGEPVLTASPAAALAGPEAGPSGLGPPASGLQPPASSSLPAAGPTEDQLLALLRADDPALTEAVAQADPAVVDAALRRFGAEVAPVDEGQTEAFHPVPADAAGQGLAREWQDWLGQNAVTGLRRAVRVNTVEAVCRVVREARALNLRVKATASGHADTTIARPDHVRIDVRGLAGELPQVPLLPLPPGDAANLVRLGAGTLVREANELLAKKGLGLVNMGGYDGQHLIGAIATGTHGSGRTLGPLADAVVAIEIVLEDGLLHRFEPEPLAASFPQGRLHVGPEFYGMVVGLGGLGVVVALTLRVRPAYELCERREVATWAVTRRRLRTRLASFRHYEVLVNPYRTAPSPWRPQPQPAEDRTTVETMRWERTTEQGAPVPDDTDEAVAPDQGARNPLAKLSRILPERAVAAVMNLAPNVIPGLMDTALRALEVPYQGKGEFYVDRSDKVLLLGTGTKAHGFEIAVPLDRVEDAVDVIIEALEHFAEHAHKPSRAFLTSPFSLRFVRGTPHWLAATHEAGMDGKPVPVWATIEIPRILGTKNPGFVVGEVERRLKKLGGRPHWGQHNLLVAADGALYPRWHPWRALAAATDPSGTFASTFLTRLGLVTGDGAETLEAAPSPVASVVHLEGEGFLAESGTPTSAETELRARFDALADVDALLVYAHGGLVPEKAGRALAASLGARIGSATDVTPLFLVWETGPFEVLLPTLRDLLTDTDLGRKLAWWVLRTLARELFPGVDQLLGSLGGAEEAVELPMPDGWVTPDTALDARTLTEQVAQRLPEDPTLAPLLASVARARDAATLEGLGLATLIDTDLRLDPAFLDEVTGVPGGVTEAAELESVSGFLGFAAVVARVALAVVKRKRSPLAWNGGRETVVEEVLRAIGGGTVGQTAWTRMKRNAAGAYLSGRGGDVLAELLAAWLQARPGRKLHLAAHSAGSFHVGGLLAALDRRVAGPARLVETLTLWAPACDHAFFAETLVPARARVGDARMFALTALAEDSDPMVPHVYERSLLTLISGLLEAEPGWPIVGMARFLDGATGPAADAVRGYLDGRTVFTPTPAEAGPGARSGAAGHAAFDDDELTRESLVARVRAVGA